MARGLDNLVEWLLEEMAYSGDQGKKFIHSPLTSAHVSRGAKEGGNAKAIPRLLFFLSQIMHIELSFFFFFF